MKKTAIGSVNRTALAAMLALAGTAFGNGGPFALRYPNGDPSSEGALARIDRSLLPARETQIEVLQEDLTITYASEPMRRSSDQAGAPLVDVVAAYRIINPTGDALEVDFGFPILRGIYISPWTTMPQPDARVTVDGKAVTAHVIDNSTIYGMIRARARQTIETAVRNDPVMAGLVGGIRDYHEARDRARRALVDNPELVQALRKLQPKLKMNHVKTREMILDYLLGTLPADTLEWNAIHREIKADTALMKLVASGMPRKQSRKTAMKGLEAYAAKVLGWDERDAVLMAEYAGIDFDGIQFPQFHPTPWFWGGVDVATELGADTNANMGALGAIGEEKATRLLAHLAARFDPKAAAGYEEIFTAWGGDMRERSIDLTTGKVRPREISLDDEKQTDVEGLPWDPSIYARVDYFDANYPVSQEQSASCERILKNLPVIFTFAPMNLLHYRVRFEPGKEQVVTVSYRQYAYTDTCAPESYQLACVVHPASLWRKFGSINLKVRAPATAAFQASVPCTRTGTEKLRTAAGEMEYSVYTAVLKEKTGELFTGIAATAWRAAFGRTKDPVETAER